MVVTLDGSYGEGGGQILRNSISYATLLHIPLEIHKIRAGRRKPGLQAQHCASLRLACRLVPGILQGDTLHSCRVTYTPPTPKDRHAAAAAAHDAPRHVDMEIGTAGSICLLLQASLPVTLFGAAATHLTLGGGTNASMAPQYDYWYEVFLPTLTSQCGLPTDAITATVKCRGYFPQGGGQVQVTIQKPLTHQQTLRPVQMTERGEPVALRIRAFHAGTWTRTQAAHMVQTARAFLQQHQPNLLLVDDVSEDIVSERHAVGSGMGLLLLVRTSTGCRLAGSALCDKKIDAAQAGTWAAHELLSTWRDGGCVDEWLQDQLIMYMALAEGTSSIMTGSLTLHTQTAIWVAEKLTDARFSVQRLDDEDPIITETTDNIQHKRHKSESSDKRRRPAPIADYGTHGRIAGRHLITCLGIGLRGRAPSEET